MHRNLKYIWLEGDSGHVLQQRRQSLKQACFKNDKRRRGEALIKQRVGVGVPEMEAKAGVRRTFYVRRYIIPLESIKGGLELLRCKLPLTSPTIPEPVFSKSHGHMGTEEILNQVIWGLLSFSSKVPTLQVTSNIIFQFSCTMKRMRNVWYFL